MNKFVVSTSIRKYFILLFSLAKHNVKKQYKNSVLGILWTILNPLLNMLVLAFVFSNIFRNGTNGMDYPIYLLSGNIVFGFLRTSTILGLKSIVVQKNLVTKTKIPYSVLPISAIISSLINFFFACVALVFVMLIRIPKGVTFHLEMLLIGPLWIAPMILFTIGISLFLSQLYVRFRDVEHLYGVLLLAWTYATPIFYPESILSGKFTLIMKLNPMYYFLKCFRLLLSGTIPNIQFWLIIYGLAILSLFIGTSFFMSTRKKMVLYL